MDSQSKMIKYMGSRKTGATALEVAIYGGVNINTVRKLLGARGPFAMLKGRRKCHVTGAAVRTYMLRSALANLTY